MNKNLLMLLRSFLTTDESDAMPKKMMPVPPAATPMSCAPLPIPSAKPTRRESIRPMKKVKPRSR